MVVIVAFFISNRKRLERSPRRPAGLPAPPQLRRWFFYNFLGLG